MGETKIKTKNMEEGILGILWLIILSVGTLVVIAYNRKIASEERKLSIEKGLNPADMRTRSNTSTPLRLALLLIGAGLGLLMGYILDMALRMEEVGYFSMLLLFAGLGLGLSYIIEEKKEKEQLA